MKLRKDKWQTVNIGDVVYELRNTANNPMEEGYERYIGFEHIQPENIYLNEFGDLNDGVTFKKTFEKNDVLFGKIRAYLKKVAIAPIDGICSGDILVLRTKNEDELSQTLLPYFLTTESFLKRAVDSSIGTTLPRTKWQHLAKHKVPLPPLKEQKQIAALFQSIETAMEQVDGQEKNLKSLQKNLVNGLVSTEPVFGNLLNSSKGRKFSALTPTTFGEIAECDKKYPEHEKEVERFVGLEWIEPENFQLQGFGLIANGTTFTKRFAKDDVLFGKRRAYLKKVAVADFDGICSGDILVIRAKAKKMLQGLLPYYISADAFIQHAVSTSAGSLSPRTKWKDLETFEVSIPDLKTQEKILEVLNQFDTTIKQLKQQKATLKLLKQKLLNEILG